MIVVDQRIGGQVRYVVTDRLEALMFVPDEIRKCVAFVGFKAIDGTSRLA